VSRRLAFDFLCRLLSLEESYEPFDRLNRTAQPHEVFWSDVVSLASEQRVSTAVWPALCGRRAVADLPKDVADYFEGVATLNRIRNAKVLSEAIELTRILNGVGAIPIFLKGGANLLSGLYPDSAMRMMFDLDVLLPTKLLPTCATALQAHGYIKLFDNGFPAHHHYPPLGRPAAAASIELHVDPIDIPYRRFLSSAEIIDHASKLTFAGAELAVPATWCRIVHSIVHTQFEDRACVYGHVRLHELLDTALLSRSGNIDWRAVRKRFASLGERTVLAYHLIGTNRLLGRRHSERGLPSVIGQSVFRRAQFQVAHPRLQAWIDRLLRPWLLLRRALSHPLLRQRLLRCLADRAWYVRQWRMLREGQEI
jgi:hypothetical protein